MGLLAVPDRSEHGTARPRDFHAPAPFFLRLRAKRALSSAVAFDRGRASFLGPSLRSILFQSQVSGLPDLRRAGERRRSLLRYLWGASCERSPSLTP